MLDELAELHQRAWASRGESGAFSKLFKSFHQQLIEYAFPSGEILIFRIAQGRKSLGLLYCFAHLGKVYFYQSGFNYSEDNRLKPGLVSHALAVEFCLERGYREYDFLAGDSRYKQSLATHSRPLEWIIIKNNTLSMKSVHLLRQAKKWAMQSEKS